MSLLHCSVFLVESDTDAKGRGRPQAGKTQEGDHRNGGKGRLTSLVYKRTCIASMCIGI